MSFHSVLPAVLSFLFLLSPVSGYSGEILQEVPLGKGVFLLADPEMRDRHFFHSVVLLLKYGDDGAAGLIINKPTDIPLKEVLADLKGIDKLSHPLFRGGPVQPDRILSLLYRNTPTDNAEKILEDVYLTTDKKVLSQALGEREPDKKIRFYMGFAGWTPGQLEREMATGSWRVVRPDAQMIFAEDPSKVWPELLHREKKLLVEDLSYFGLK